MNFIKKILSVSFILFKLICLIFDHGLFSRRFEMSGFNLLELEYIQVDLIKNWSEIVNQLISLFLSFFYFQSAIGAWSQD